MAAAAALGTWLARAYAVHRDLLDHPGERRSHSTATPRGGGIAIVAVLLLGLAGAAAGLAGPVHPGVAGAFAVGLALVALVGLLDDHRPLSPWLRLVVHAVAAAVFALALWRAGGAWPLAAAVFAAILVLVNVWNFMDGINGIAASQALLVAAGLAAALDGGGFLVALALAAACAGFLPYNFPRARIFMGDVGSGALGFALAALGGVFGAGAGPASGLLLFLPLSAFLVDAGLTLGRRVVRGERWWTPHVQHAYQAWARRVGHVPVTLAYGAWTVAGLVLAWACRDVDAVFILCICAGWYTGAASIWWLLQRHGRSGGETGTE
nr:hypothetical protein [Lysobacter sp. GX 14042]